MPCSVRTICSHLTTLYCPVQRLFVPGGRNKGGHIYRSPPGLATNRSPAPRPRPTEPSPDIHTIPLGTQRSLKIRCFDSNDARCSVYSYEIALRLVPDTQRKKYSRVLLPIHKSSARHRRPAAGMQAPLKRRGMPRTRNTLPRKPT